MDAELLQNFYWNTSDKINPRRIWEDNIRMVLTEIGIKRMKWIQLAEGSDQWRAFMNATLNLQIP